MSSAISEGETAAGSYTRSVGEQARAMIRACVTTPLSFDVSVVDGSDGRPHYKLNGAPLGIIEVVRIIDQLFFNRSFTFASGEEECIDEMKRNQSDFTTAFISIDQMSEHYSVPVSVLISVTTIITGYDITKSKVTNDADAMANFQLLELPVYLIALVLTMMMIMVISAKTLTHYHDEVMRARIIRRNKVTDPKHLIRIVYEEIYASFYGSSDTCRYLSLLYVVLCFYMSTSFNAKFTTSQIAFEEPNVVTTYQQLLNKEKALPIFYDTVSKVSDQFQQAHQGSLKSRVWSKLINSGKVTEYVLDPKEMANDPIGMVRKWVERIDNQDVVIASSLTSNMILTFSCGSTPEGESEKLMRLVEFTDPDEKEVMIGWAISSGYKFKDLFAAKMRKTAESGVMRFLQLTTTEAYMYVETFGLASKKHIQKQKNICSSDYKPDLGDEVKALTNMYFTVFFSVCFCVQVVAIFVNLLERRTKIRRVAPRRRGLRIIRSA